LSRLGRIHAMKLPPGAALLAAAALLAGCESMPPRQRTPAYEPVELVFTTSAQALATELGLKVKAEPATRTLALEGEAGRIVFVDQTHSAVVAGQALRTREPLRISGIDLPLSEADAAAVRAAWTEAQTEAGEQAGRSPGPSARARRPGAASGDEAWKVPLTREWQGILIHHSATEAGNLAQFDKHHREVNKWLGVGYDFIICNGQGGPDGLVETTFRWKKQIQGAHAGSDPAQKKYNEHWIGICLVGDFNGSRPSSRQLASLRRLIRFLQDYCDIPDSSIRMHRDIRDTDCPGTRFPLQEILRDPPRGK